MFAKSEHQIPLGIILVSVVAAALMIGISVFAFVQLSQISSTVDALTDELAVERDLSRDIINQGLLMRFYALQYVRTERQEDLDRFYKAANDLEISLTNSRTQTTSSQRVNMLDRIETASTAYRKTFEEVTALVRQRQNIYATVLDLQEIDIEYRMSALRIHANFLTTPRVFLAFTNLQNAFRLMTVHTTRYLEAGEEQYAVQFRAGYEQIQAALLSLEGTVTDPAQLQNLASMRTAVETYVQGFGEVSDSYRQSTALLGIMLDELGPEISVAAREISSDINREFHTRNAASQALIAQTRGVLIFTTITAMSTGLGLSVVLSRYFTERLRTERMLRESEERYRTLFERSPVGLYRSTPSGAILDANPAFVEMLGYPSREDLLEITAFDLYVDPEDRSRWMHAIVTAGSTRDFEVRFRRYDGREILVRNSAQVIKDAQGRALHFEGSLEDITEQVQAEEELKRYRDHLEGLVEARTAELTNANQQLRQEIAERVRTEEALEQARRVAEAANQAKSVFLANMSHELRTPLNAILGFSELMTRESNITTDQRENLDIIGRSGQHLLGLINDVLELSKIEAGRVELQLEDFNLHQMLLGLGEMFSLRAEQKGLTMVFDFAPGVPQYIRADQGKLRQILINLLGNAVKFTKKGGVTLRVRSSNPVEDNQAFSAGTQDDEGMRYRQVILDFDIADSGVGIAPDELDRVFDAFVQTQSGRHTKGGTGLGLTLSRDYVRLMRGDLTVESELGVGTTFRFGVLIEVLDEAQISALRSTRVRRRAAKLAPGQPTYRVLVADDAEASRWLLVKLLQPLGFEIREATNGEEALAQWVEWQPHLIFMDMRMPVMSGREAMQRIKTAVDKGSRKPVVVALTASAFEEDRTSIVAAGCDDFIRKPFQEFDVFSALEKHLGVRFEYEEVTTREVGGQPQPRDLSLLMETLPVEWIAQVRAAAINADFGQLVDLVEDIQPEHPVVAEGLADLVDSFDYEAILKLCV